MTNQSVKTTTELQRKACQIKYLKSQVNCNTKACYVKFSIKIEIIILWTWDLPMSLQTLLGFKYPMFCLFAAVFCTGNKSV